MTKPPISPIADPALQHSTVTPKPLSSAGA
jgi:hypothetical protein